MCPCRKQSWYIRCLCVHLTNSCKFNSVNYKLCGYNINNRPPLSTTCPYQYFFISNTSDLQIMDWFTNNGALHCLHTRVMPHLFEKFTGQSLGEMSERPWNKRNANTDYMRAVRWQSGGYTNDTPVGDRGRLLELTTWTRQICLFSSQRPVSTAKVIQNLRRVLLPTILLGNNTPRSSLGGAGKTNSTWIAQDQNSHRETHSSTVHTRDMVYIRLGMSAGHQIGILRKRKCPYSGLRCGRTSDGPRQRHTRHWYSPSYSVGCTSFKFMVLKWIYAVSTNPLNSIMWPLIHSFHYVSGCNILFLI